MFVIIQCEYPGEAVDYVYGPFDTAEEAEVYSKTLPQMPAWRNGPNLYWYDVTELVRPAIY